MLWRERGVILSDLKERGEIPIYAEYQFQSMLTHKYYAANYY
jgi:hypothetical protein